MSKDEVDERRIEEEAYQQKSHDLSRSLCWHGWDPYEMDVNMFTSAITNKEDGSNHVFKEEGMQLENVALNIIDDGIQAWTKDDGVFRVKLRGIRR